MDEGMKLYYDYTVSPLGKLFYRTVQEQLKDIKGKKVLDFGSGFGFTTSFLAKNNDVTAVEYNSDMIAACEKSVEYTQRCGGIEVLENMEDETFEVVVCHLVLEFVPNPKDILAQLIRVLKKGGTLSLVRHNRNGRLVQAVVQDYNITDANALMKGGFSYSSAFGDIKYFQNEDVDKWCENSLDIQKIYGIRTLASLHDAKVQSNENWAQDMFEIENKLSQDEDFIKIAYFNHILYTKNRASSK